MAATVASRRKRGPDAFLDDPFASPSDPAPLAKRGRCSPLGVAAADLGLSFPLEFDPIDALRLIFPDADPQVLREYFEASGNVLDAAITAFKDHMANKSTESASPLPAGNRENLVTSSEVDVPAVNIPTNEWAELIVNEMSSASDMVDAKKRAFRIIELFEKSTVQIGPHSKSIQEHKVVKQMLESLLHQNGVLKRAFLVQHNRLKDYEEMVQERSQFKQIVEKYQEQIKALEDKNYFLSFHLQQANQHSSFSSHRNPDVC